ncbi:MAG: cytochrome c [Trueperaceae bacterium]
MPEPIRQYLFSERQIRMAFVLGTIGMVAVLVAILLLATSKPQGSLVPLDTAAFDQQVAAATTALAGYEELGDGRARIDIDHAMQLVVERGVGNPGFVALGAAPAAAAATPAPPSDAAAPGDAGAPADAGDAGGDAGAPAAQAGADLPDGAAVFTAVCLACHQANAQGIPGAFPPLADGHAVELYAADRDYPILVVLYGLQGQIEVAGVTYNSVMTPQLQLEDAEIAAVLNHVMTSFGNEATLPEDFAPYTVEDVTAQRNLMLMSNEIHDRRVEIGLP